MRLIKSIHTFLLKHPLAIFTVIFLVVFAASIFLSITLNNGLPIGMLTVVSLIGLSIGSSLD